MVHFGQQGLEPRVAGAQILFGARLFPRQAAAFQHLFEAGGEQVEEVLAHRLDDIVRGTRLQRGDRDPALVRSGDVDHRRRLGQRLQPF